MWWRTLLDFPGGSGVKNPPANAASAGDTRDTASCPGTLSAHLGPFCLEGSPGCSLPQCSFPCLWTLNPGQLGWLGKVRWRRTSWYSQQPSHMGAGPLLPGLETLYPFSRYNANVAAYAFLNLSSSFWNCGQGGSPDHRNFLLRFIEIFLVVQYVISFA